MMIFPLLGSGANGCREISNLPQMLQLMPQNSSPQKKQWNVGQMYVLNLPPDPVKVANEGLQNAVLLLVTGILGGG